MNNSVLLDLPKSSLINLATLPHTVREFGVEARKPGGAWEAAFNGPIHSWAETETDQIIYGVTVRLSRIKDQFTRELYSTNILFAAGRNVGNAQCL